jgi:antitoxin component YwqK of YwqJK toxin-antitoxin module
MKLIKTLLTILFISLLSSPSWSVTIDDLVKREGIYYKKFTVVPFNGEVTGNEQGSFKNGKRDGAWVRYYENGQLMYKGNYKNGMKDGAKVGYYENGSIWYKEDFKNGKLEGAQVSYWETGQVWYKGNNKYGKREGAWVWNNKDGTVFAPLTGIFKNGMKISD